jgi:hypothetical protein
MRDLRERRAASTHSGNQSSVSQSRITDGAQAKLACGRRAPCGALPMVASGTDTFAAICVCTVRATATVAKSAAATAVAERIFIVLDIVFMPRFLALS